MLFIQTLIYKDQGVQKQIRYKLNLAKSYQKA